MHSEQPHSSALRFATDLRKIREARKVSIEAIHEETKVPLGLIEQFEQTALRDHEMFNEVYLRSFVRSYASVLEMDEALALKALESVFSDQYDGVLAVKYLGEKPKAPPPPPPPPPKAAPSPPPAPTQKQAPKMPPSMGQASPASKKKATPARSKPSAQKKAEPAKEKKTPIVPPWKRGGKKFKATPKRTSGGVPVLGLIVGGSLVVMVAFFWFFLRDPSPDADVTPTPVVVADTVATAPPEPVREPIAVQVPMTFWVVAESGPVREIRIKRDEDLRRPYWIEQGDSLSFEASNRISFTNQLDKVRLMLQGHRITIPRPDTTLVFTPQTAEAVLNRP